MKKSIVLSLLLLLSFGVGWPCVFYPVTNYYIYKVVPADDAASGPSLYEGSIRKWADYCGGISLEGGGCPPLMGPVGGGSLG